MRRFLSLLVVVGAVLLAGPSPIVAQPAVRNPAVRLIVNTRPGVPPGTGAYDVYLVSGALGCGAFVSSSGNWVLLNRRLPRLTWVFRGNTEFGDNTYEAVLVVTEFWYDTRIVGAHGVISWPAMTLRVHYYCQELLVDNIAYIQVGPGTRAGILAGSHPSGTGLDAEILDTVILPCYSGSTNTVQGAWLTNGYAGRWFDVEGFVSTNQVGATVVTNRFSVGGVTVREVVVNVDSNTVTSVNVLSNEVAGVVGASGTTAQQVMGSILGGAVARSVMSGSGRTNGLQLSVTVTNDVKVDWSEGHEYSRDQLPSTNWSWVMSSVRSAVGEGLGQVSQLSDVSAGYGVSAPTWSIPLRMPSGVWSWDFDVSVWTGRGGAVVKRVLEVLVLLGLWLLLHRQIVDDLRSAWCSPQARTAGQTVLGTGSQLLGALGAAAAILGVLLTLSSAVLAWFAGGLGNAQGWLSDLTLAGGLLGEFLRLGPWEVMLSGLSVWVVVWASRPYWIALTHAAVRFITGV